MTDSSQHEKTPKDNPSTSDSSNNGKSPKDKSSTSDHQSSTNADTSPPVAAPHMMYYQPGTGYPGHGPQPPPYPYPPPPNGYPPYPQGYNNYPGPAQYYNTPQNYNHAGNASRSFFRGFIMCSCFLFTGLFVFTLILSLMLHPQLPSFKVTSFSVSNFNTTSILTGDWNISVTVQNPNDKLRGYFSDFNVDVVHDINELAVSFVPNFELDKHEQKQMDVKASSNNMVNGVSFQKWDLDKMSNERQSGSVMFDVRVSTLVEFKSSSFSTRSNRMMAICGGLKVVFQNNTGTGTWENGGNPVTCQLYI